jgi:acyl carrier protein
VLSVPACCAALSLSSRFELSENWLNSEQLGLEDRLIKLVKDLLGPTARLPDPFPVEQQLSELGLSSLKMVNLMLSVELEFDLMIPQTEISPENFHSLSSIARMVTKLLPPSP